jgi:hypothetical protein
VNQAFVRTFLDGHDALGRSVSLPELVDAGATVPHAPAIGQPFEMIDVVASGRLLLIRADQNPALLTHAITQASAP